VESHEELLTLSERLKVAGEKLSSSAFNAPLKRLSDAIDAVIPAFSGSWLGYHANVYYAELRRPPPGAHFSQEWGLEEAFHAGTTGDWEEWNPQVVRSYIQRAAGSPDLTEVEELSKAALGIFDVAKSEAMSILHNEQANGSDTFLDGLRAELDLLKAVTSSDAIEHLKPQGQVMTRDMVALGQGYRVPPHVYELAEVLSYRHNAGISAKAGIILQKAGSHLERRRRRASKVERIGTNVFIGHGRSAAWRELKDFVSGRLSLPWDEFNRVPVAGITNIARLSEMLDAAAIAFLVMTAEDEMADGGIQARMNVVHEAGLFQGRLGFTRAIVLLEEGCSEFSNIQGLGQIRFPKGRISAIFEDVRLVLERESLIAEES
jgi:predicted nucleotide-binding protein